LSLYRKSLCTFQVEYLDKKNKNIPKLGDRQSKVFVESKIYDSKNNLQIFCTIIFILALTLFKKYFSNLIYAWFSHASVILLLLVIVVTVNFSETSTSGVRELPTLREAVAFWNGRGCLSGEFLFISIRFLWQVLIMYLCYKFYTYSTVLFFFFLKINFSYLLDAFKLGKKPTENIYTVRTVQFFFFFFFS